MGCRSWGCKGSDTTERLSMSIDPLDHPPSFLLRFEVLAHDPLFPSTISVVIYANFTNYIDNFSKILDFSSDHILCPTLRYCPHGFFLDLDLHIITKSLH